MLIVFAQSNTGLGAYTRQGFQLCYFWRKGNPSLMLLAQEEEQILQSVTPFLQMFSDV